jgi:hypothetical protein
MSTTTTAQAPLEAEGDKVLFVIWDDTGTNREALLRAIHKIVQNLEPLAHLAVASHEDGVAVDVNEPVVLAAGSDGTYVLKLLVDALGSLVVAGQGTAGFPGGGVLTVQGVGGGTALTVQPPYTPNVFKSLSGVVITSETTIWTPASGKKFRLMGFVITQTVVTGDITLKDNTGGSTILVIPATPVGQPLYVPLGNGILSGAADRVLTATGASTEAISGFVFGIEE